MNFTLQLTQKIAQTLTTEQFQHLEILQLSDLELENYIYEKACENPLITIKEAEVKQLNHLLDFTTINRLHTSSTDNQFDYDYTQSALAQKESVFTFLFEQIPLHQNLSELDRMILSYLIYNLNEKFFLDVTVEEVSKKFHVKVEIVENLLYLLHTFEPIGIGARNLIEYLLIQIDNDLSAPPLASEFVKYHLDKVADLSISYLSKTYNISSNETQKIIQYIRSLQPSPYVEYTTPTENYILPEVITKKVNDEWIIQITNSSIPSIEINEEYVQLLQSSNEHELYCQNCLKDILILNQGIEQRNRTLYSLIRVLLTIQAEFFEYGIEALRPVRLKDIAEILDLHESTISRAIRNKYIRTPHGTFLLRSLFIKGLTNHSGKMDSVTYVKKRISSLIKEENKQSPLSDQQLTILLQSEDIQISRRTVAKYREELNIHSSTKRAYFYRNKTL